MQKNDAFSSLLQQAARMTGSDPKSLLANAQSGKLSGITDHMQPQDARRFQAILRDPKQIEQLLQSPQAKSLLKMLTEQEGAKHGGSG